MLSRQKLLPLFLLFILGIFYFVIRLYNILHFPIFTDEAIYVRWAQIAAHDASWRFISLTDGKQPMYVWIAMILMRFFKDPLLAGRMVSVLAGFASMVGLYFVGRETFKNPKIGLVASLLYLIYPFALVYDRMALYDSLVGAFTVWSLYFSVVLARYLRLDAALILGLVIGGGMLTKTNAFFSLLLLPMSGFISDFTHKDRLKRFSRFLFLCGVVAFIAFMHYAILRLSPFYHIISEKNNLFVYPLGEWKQHPFVYFWPNMSGLWDWFWKYMTIPWVALIPFAIFFDWKFFREKILLVVWFLVPFVYLIFFGRTIYPRFIFFMTLALIPLVSYGLVLITEKIRNKTILYIIIALLFILPLRSGYLIYTDFVHAPIPDPDKQQYYTDWPSGIGVKETVAFLQKEAEKGKIYVGTEGTFGLMPYALEIYLVDNPNIIIKGFWPIEAQMPKELIDARTKYPTYFISYQACGVCDTKGTGPRTWPLKTIMKFNKPNNARLSVFQVTP